jgi:glycosyltransferase involved in cell wall biosynthesis
MNDLSIIISTFNEEGTIVPCLERIAAVAPEAEVLIIHGGRDRTAEIAREYARAHPRPHLRVFENYGDSGKGHAIKVGITLASHPLQLQFDADLQFAPEDIPAMLAPLREGKADVVVGSRFMKGADRSGYAFSFFRDVGNKILNRFISLMAGTEISDVTTGMKAWTREAIWKIRFKDNRFVYEMEIVMRAARNGLRIVQLPVKYSSRQGGHSGHGTGFKEFKSIVTTGASIAWRALLIRVGMW